jgi:hypothetical protein
LDKKKILCRGLFSRRSGQDAWLELSAALPDKQVPETLDTHDTGMVVLGNACAVLADVPPRALSRIIAIAGSRTTVTALQIAQKYGGPNMASRYVPTHDS